MNPPPSEQTERERWREDIHSALTDFCVVSELARDKLSLSDATVEYLSAPHRPRPLPAGKMAVYGFCLNGSWLKIGEVGPNSGPRYVSQHYTGSARSTLAGSIRKDQSPSMKQAADLDKASLAAWIKCETSRVNILLLESRGRQLRLLLEAFLHTRLRPRYEG